MDKITKILEYIYGNLDVFNPLSEYLLYVYKSYPLWDLTNEEYVSMVCSFDFNTQGYYKRRIWRPQ